jgi:lysophospholipid acyltransferase (LPLAT)-like uncharacterized protein
MALLYNRIQFWAAGAAGSAVARLLGRTWRVRIVQPDALARRVWSGRRHAIVAFWHGHLLTLMCTYRGWPFCVPVSEHRDGEYVAQIMERNGFLAVRGSSTRGAVKLLRGLTAAGRQGWNCAITPDGPQGPRHSVKPGFAMLARRLRAPVYPMGVAVDKAWVLNSWDGFVIPKPTARVCIHAGDPLDPEAADRLRSRAVCADMKERLTRANECAAEELRGRLGGGR